MKKLFLFAMRTLTFNYLAGKVTQHNRLMDRVKFLEGRVEGLSKSDQEFREAFKEMRINLEVKKPKIIKGEGLPHGWPA